MSDEPENKTWADLTEEERTQQMLDIFGPPPTEEEQAASRRLHEAYLAQLNAGIPEEMSFVDYGGACPEQGFGWWASGEAVYFRYRSDFATLEVGPREEDRDPEAYGWPMPDRDRVRLYAELDSWADDTWRGQTTDVAEAIALVTRLHSMLRPVGEWEHGTRAQRFGEFVQRLVAAREAQGDSEP